MDLKMDLRDQKDHGDRTTRDPRAHGKSPGKHGATQTPHAPGKTLATPDLIKCAECFNCKQYQSLVPGTAGRYFLRVKCEAGRWRRNGKNVSIHLHRVLSRSRHNCDDYETTSDRPGDRLGFLYQLKESLPDEAHMYEPDGSFVDKIEQYKICLNAT